MKKLNNIFESVERFGKKFTVANDKLFRELFNFRTSYLWKSPYITGKND